MKKEYDLKMKYLIILSLSFVINLSSAFSSEDCHRYIGTCDYYLCREKNKNCNENGYFIGFGYKYCQASLTKLINNVSPNAKSWLLKTATCLQKQLDQLDDSLTCSEIQEKAIEGHDSCYQEVNFCGLSIEDKAKIIKMLLPALQVKGVVHEGFQVIYHCVENL